MATINQRYNISKTNKLITNNKALTGMYQQGVSWHQDVKDFCASITLRGIPTPGEILLYSLLPWRAEGALGLLSIDGAKSLTHNHSFQHMLN